MRRLILSLVPLALAACAQTAPAVSDEPEGLTGMLVSEEIATGETIAADQCARCHGLGQEEARRSDAPALRHVLADYEAEALRESFREGIKVGHPDMPDFTFGPMGADFLLAYLESIQETEAVPPAE